MKRRSLLALCLLAGCGGSTFPTPGPARGPTRLADPEVRAIAEILRMEDHRSWDAGTADRLSESPSVEVRRRVVTAAGRIGDPDAIPFLVHALEGDPQAAVQADAAFALGLMGDSSDVVLRALRRAAPAGWAPVRTPATDVVVEVVAAAGRIGSEEARRMVTDALRSLSPIRGPHARRIVAEALLASWRSGDGPGRVLPIVPFLDEEDPEIRWRAAYALMRMGGAEGARWLLPATTDEDHQVRANAVRGLGAARADSAGIRDTALVLLRTAVADPHPHVRINALRALGGYGDDAPLDLIAAGLRDEVPLVSVAAATALAGLGARAADALAEAAAAADLSDPARGAALEGLAAVQPARAWPIVEPWTRDRYGLRYAAARSLAAFGWERAGAALDRLTRDEDTRVAVAALGSAATIAADTGRAAAERQAVRPLLLERVVARRAVVRAASLAALEPVARPGDVPVLLDAFAMAEAAGETAAAVAAVRTLGAVEEQGSGAADAFFRAFPEPAGDRWVRRRVADRLGARWGTPPAAVAAAELPFYEEIARRYVVPVLGGADRPRAVIGTSAGEITVELLSEEAPLTVHNFVTLAGSGFYDDGAWHRVVPNFVLQDGAPSGDTGGGPGWSIRDEINRVRYDRGILGMALAGPDTGGSQWFITHSPQPHLDGGYTVFGRVVDGMEAADRVLQGDPNRTVRTR